MALNFKIKSDKSSYLVQNLDVAPSIKEPV
jgi:hypothetical protein